MHPVVALKVPAAENQTILAMPKNLASAAKIKRRKLARNRIDFLQTTMKRDICSKIYIHRHHRDRTLERCQNDPQWLLCRASIRKMKKVSAFTTTSYRLAAQKHPHYSATRQTFDPSESFVYLVKEALQKYFSSKSMRRAAKAIIMQ